MIPSVFASFRALFATGPVPRTAKLGLDTFEDRLVPASITFADGVLYVAADEATNDHIQITPLGPNMDGSTGVKVFTNVTGVWTTQMFGDAANPVTNIALDMKNGNDFVKVAALRATTVFVGEGNGNNVVQIGDTKSAGLIAGSGQNIVRIGGGSVNLFGDSSLPNMAGSAVFLGWNYNILNGGRDLFTAGTVGNENANVVHMATAAGERSIVDVFGNGNNSVTGGAGDDQLFLLGNGANTIRGGQGNDLLIVNGGGDNWIGAGRGNDQVFVTGSGNNVIRGGYGDDTIAVNGSGNNRVHSGDGNNNVNINGGGNNSVWTRGTGSLTVTGGGQNAVRARYSPGVTIALNGTGPDSSIVASLASGVFVDGAQVLAPGVVGNVKVKLV